MDAVPNPSATESLPALAYETVRPIRSVRPLTIMLIILLSLSLTGILTTAVANILVAHLWQQTIDKVPLNPSEVTIANALFPLTPFVMLPPMVPTFIVLLAWMYRTNKNLRLLFPARIRFSTAQTIGYWFLPRACLIKPFEMMKEFYVVSREMPKQKFTPTIGIWWATWLLGNLLWQLANIAGAHHDSGDTVEQVYVAEATWHVFPAPLLLLSGLLLMRTVYVIDRGTERRRSLISRTPYPVSSS